MIFIPSDAHFWHMLSRSIMLSVPRYSTGINPCSDATRVTDIIGDGICLPVANHDSLSHTQKSGSVCEAIANLSVMIMLSWVSYS